MSGVRGCDRRNRQIQIGRFSKQRCVNGWPLVQLQMKAGSNKIGAAHHPRERAAPISVNAPPSQEVGVAPIPTRNCGRLVVTNTVRRQILECRCRDDTRAATVLPSPNWPAGFYYHTALMC